MEALVRGRQEEMEAKSREVRVEPDTLDHPAARYAGREDCHIRLPPFVVLEARAYPTTFPARW